MKTAKATEAQGQGQAQLYIICLPEVYGWTFKNRQFDPTLVKEGAIAALTFNEYYP